MGSRVDELANAYSSHVSLPWEKGLAPPQRVWFLVYPKEEERRLRYKVDAFQLATSTAGKKWVLIDITNSFAKWMQADKYREACFQNPQTMAPKIPQFLHAVAQDVVSQAKAASAGEDTVVAVLGVAGLFGFTQVSELVPKIIAELPSRLLVFFPGSRDGNVYKLLDAREGWNYLATPIAAQDSGSTT